MRLAREEDKVPARGAAEECGVRVRLREMTLRERGWQVMPYQRQWLADESHFQEERRPEGSPVTEFLKLRRDIASSDNAKDNENAKERIKRQERPIFSSAGGRVRGEQSVFKMEKNEFKLQSPK